MVWSGGVFPHGRLLQVICVPPPNPTLQQTAQRILSGVALRWQTSGQAARALKVRQRIENAS
jgi:hypothetical protein